jgi:hypothetical protein
MFFQEQRIYNEIIKGKEGKDLEEDGSLSEDNVENHKNL